LFVTRGLREDRYVVLRFVRPSFADGLVTAICALALIGACAIWTATHPAPVLLAPTPNPPGPLKALWTGAVVTVVVGVIGIVLEWRSLRATIPAASTVPEDASLAPPNGLGVLLPIIGLLVAATVVTGLNPVAGGLTGGLLLGIAAVVGFVRWYVGRWECDGSARFLTADGEVIYLLPAGSTLPAAKRPPAAWRRLLSRASWRLWAKRIAAAAGALLAAGLTALAALVLLATTWVLVLKPNADDVRDVQVAQALEIIALLVLLACTWLYYNPLLRRFTGGRHARSWIMLPFTLLLAIPITVLGQGVAPDAVGGRQAEETAADLAQILSGSPRKVSYEIMLLVDPAGAPGRQLLTLADRDPDALEVPLHGSVPWRISVGVATLEPMADRSDPPMNVVQPVTEDSGSVADALKRLEPRPGKPATSSLPAALQELESGAFGGAPASILPQGIAPRVIKAIVIPFDGLPGAKQLDAPLPPAPSQPLDCPPGLTLPQCRVLFGEPEAPAPPRWSQVVRDWRGPPVFVEAPDTPARAAAEWRGWLRGLHGRLLDPATYASSHSLIQRAEAAVTGRARDEVPELAFEFRPPPAIRR
jgi:hypothetical protein